MRFGIAAVLGLAMASMACRHSVAPSANELLAAPLSITVGAQKVALASYLWRDFMPSSPPDGKPLVAIFRLLAVGNGAVPTSLRIDAAWILFGDEVWSATITEERSVSATQSHYEAVARDGPKWGPGVNVDVIVRVRDAQGTAQLLRAPDQPIGRTD
jgi:hypothetical protein